MKQLLLLAALAIASGCTAEVMPEDTDEVKQALTFHRYYLNPGHDGAPNNLFTWPGVPNHHFDYIDDYAADVNMADANTFIDGYMYMDYPNGTGAFDGTGEVFEPVEALGTMPGYANIQSISAVRLKYTTKNTCNYNIGLWENQHDFNVFPGTPVAYPGLQRHTTTTTTIPGLGAAWPKSWWQSAEASYFGAGINNNPALPTNRSCEVRFGAFQLQIDAYTNP